MKRDNTIEIIKELKKLGIITIAKRKSKSRRKYNAKFYRSKQVPPQLPPPYVRGVQTFTQTPQKHMMDEQAQLNIELGKKALIQPLLENRSFAPSSIEPKLTIKDYGDDIKLIKDDLNTSKNSVVNMFNKFIPAIEYVNNFRSQNNYPDVNTKKVQQNIAISQKDTPMIKTQKGIINKPIIETPKEEDLTEVQENTIPDNKEEVDTTEYEYYDEEGNLTDEHGNIISVKTKEKVKKDKAIKIDKRKEKSLLIKQAKEKGINITDARKYTYEEIVTLLKDT